MTTQLIPLEHPLWRLVALSLRSPSLFCRPDELLSFEESLDNPLPHSAHNFIRVTATTQAFDFIVGRQSDVRAIRMPEKEILILWP